MWCEVWWPLKPETTFMCLFSWEKGAGTECAAWKVEGLIRREGSAGTTVLVNSATTVLSNAPSWGMALSANTSLGCLKIEVTGAAKTIRWVATIHTSELTFA